jgi:transketolase
VRKAFVKALCREAYRNPKIILITGDLGYNVLEPFREKFPNRFLNTGVAEANLVNLAAGLSTMGFIPFVYSIATFMSMRPFEQIRNNVSLQNLNVKIVGIGGGLAYTKAGPTHHSMEDIALMRLLPNITIIAPSDSDTAYQATKAIVRHEGPVYLRLERNPQVLNYLKPETFHIERGRQIVKGEKIAILATGTKVELALRIASILEKRKLRPSVFSFSTIQPLDKITLNKIFKKHSFIATVEEHRTSGGFGSAVEEFAVGKGLNKVRLAKFGLKNFFSEASGNYEALLKLHDFTPEAIARSIYAKVR